MSTCGMISSSRRSRPACLRLIRPVYVSYALDDRRPTTEWERQQSIHAAGATRGIRLACSGHFALAFCFKPAFSF